MGIRNGQTDKSKQPLGSTVSGYGGKPFLSGLGAALSNVHTGFIHDSVSGVSGRNAEEFYENAKKKGMRNDQIEEALRRQSK